MVDGWNDNDRHVLISPRTRPTYTTMPRSRPRAKVIRKLNDIIFKRRQFAFLRHVVFDDDDSIEDLIDLQYESYLRIVSSKRYLFRAEKYRNRNSFFNWDDCLSENSLRFNEEEFLRHFRVSRENFWHLVSLLENHDIFKSRRRRGRRMKHHIPQHVLVFLYRLGCQGSAASDTAVANFFGIGKGTVKNFIRRVVSAIRSLKDTYIVWPSGSEKEEMKQRIKVKYGFQQCIGIIDGTLIVLATRPQEYGDSYYCRKNCYAINVQIICDDKANITYVYGGWPGSTHDNRAWRNSKVFKDAPQYFTDGEYVVGDSAYSQSPVMVQSFKKASGEGNLTHHKEFFNTKLASLRVRGEHCIGILKNRFPWLKNCNILLDSEDGMKEILQLLECSCILHNIFLQHEDDIPPEWYEDIDNGHYWTSDADGNTVGDMERGDRREAVFRAFINDYYI